MKDVVAANVFFATQSPATGVFNVAYGRGTTINDLAQDLVRQTGSRSVLQHAPGRPGDVKHSLAAIDRLRAAGFKPGGTLSSGLAVTLAWFAAGASQPA